MRDTLKWLFEWENYDQPSNFGLFYFQTIRNVRHTFDSRIIMRYTDILCPDSRLSFKQGALPVESAKGNPHFVGKMVLKCINQGHLFTAGLRYCTRGCFRFEWSYEEFVWWLYIHCVHTAKWDDRKWFTALRWLKPANSNSVFFHYFQYVYIYIYILEK